MPIDAADLWRVPLQPTDQLALESVFARCPDLWPWIGRLCGGLVPLGAHQAFVGAFVRSLRSGAPDDARRYVLAAAAVALEEVSWQH